MDPCLHLLLFGTIIGHRPETKDEVLRTVFYRKKYTANTSLEQPIDCRQNKVLRYKQTENSRKIYQVISPIIIYAYVSKKRQKYVSVNIDKPQTDDNLTPMSRPCTVLSREKYG